MGNDCFFIDICEYSSRCGFLYRSVDDVHFFDAFSGLEASVDPKDIVAISSAVFDLIRSRRKNSENRRMQLIRKYRNLQPDHVYLMFNSETHPGVFEYRGYLYNEDWYEDAITLHKVGARIPDCTWPACEFQFAFALE